MLQKAADQKFDRDPRVVQQIDAARRDIIAKAYLEKISSGAPKPTPAEVSGYYEAHPALFQARRIYNLQELNIDATPEQVPVVKAALTQAKTFPDFVAFLKDKAFRFVGNEVVRAAEQLPLADVDKFAGMKDGDTMLNTRPGGVQVVRLVQSRPMAVNAAQATPAIEQFLLNDRKRKLMADDLAALRSAAKIEYVGQFAVDAAKSPYQAPSVPDARPVTRLAPTLPASAVNAAPQVDVTRTERAPASMPSGDTLDKGLKGFK
ncbi:MAG: EpsD family peptidyl-prolyl cis-trans isomerase [Pseudomonadota bacterium]|nr:EpsD family peptidyl-prolyl cis-trans isomerase [Pseudomonadota bacterium]